MKRLFAGVLLALVGAHGVGGCEEPGLLRRVPRASVAGQIDFGVVLLGAVAERALVVRSRGTAPLTVFGADTDHAALALELPSHLGGAIEVPPGDSIEIRVTWAPTEVGPVDAAVTVYTDSADRANQVVSVGGEAAPIPSCDDRNPCTGDRFDHGEGRCVHPPRSGACDDGSACTEEDRCVEGVCVGAAVRCADGIECTRDDVCDPETGCLFVPEHQRCDDGQPCTTDLCEPESGCHSPVVEDGTPCGPLTCQVVSLCQAGACTDIDIVGGAAGLPCDDGDPCEANDTCDDAGTCRPGAPASFARFYRCGSNARFHSLVATPDGGLAVLGTTGWDEASGGYNMWLLRTDAAGRLVWQERWRESRSSGQALALVADGFAAAGQLRVDGVDVGLLVRIDTEANRIRETILGDAGHVLPSAAAALPDSSVVLAGGARIADHSGDVWISRLDSDGNALWEDFVTPSETLHRYAATAVVTMADSGVAVLWQDHRSWSIGPGAWSGANTYWVRRLDSGGDVLWETSPMPEGPHFWPSLVATDDGGVALSVTGGGDGAGKVLRLDASGQERWRSELPGSGDFTTSRVVLLFDPSTRGFLAMASDGDGGLWFWRIDALGNLEASAVLDLEAGQEHHVESAVLLEDGAVALAGWRGGGGLVARLLPFAGCRAPESTYHDL